MTSEQFDLAFKRFSRCMKDNGYYCFVKNYLFPNGRTKNDLLGDINDKMYNTSFSMLLGYINLLGPSYDRLGINHWNEFIKAPYEIWLNECREKYKEYLKRI